MKLLVAALLLVSPLLADDTREARLENGLKVIVHRMTGAPLVTVMTMYRVGSANEAVGQTGITHLCEHMLFKGSRKFPSGEVNTAVERLGGYINGYTNVEQITFFQVVPKEHLEEFLDRHADAMDDATFDPEEFKKEMVVVRSELEGDENSPAFLLERSIFATAFQTHGLHWPVIGWRADVERVTADQVKAYYKAWFRPNNAVVVVVGDIDLDATVEEVRKRFAAIAPGATPPEPTPEPPQDGERRITVRAAAATPSVEVAYHVPPTGHPDMFVMEVMQDVLGEGHSSRLYRALVDTGLATAESVGNYWCKYPTLFTIHADCAPGKQPAEVEAAIDKEVDRLRKDGVTAEECSRAIRFIVRSRAFSTDSTEKVASAIADFEAYSSWRYGLGFAEEVQKVTPERVLACAKKYLVRDSRVVGELIPPEKTDSPDLRGAMGEVDRAPKLGAAAGGEAREPKPPVEFKLANGLRVLFWENPSSPTVSIKVRWPGGTAQEGDEWGLASVALEMLHEGTKAHDKAAFNALLEAKGFSIEHTVHAEFAEVSTAGLAEDFETGAMLLGEMLVQPAFPEAAFAVAKDRVKGKFEQEADSPDDTALRVIRHALFGSTHPCYAPTLDDLLTSVGKVKLDDVRRFHGDHCQPSGAILAVAGALDEKRVRDVAEKAFGALKEPEMAVVHAATVTEPDREKKRFVVFQPDKSQVFGGVAMPCSIKRNSPDWATFDVWDHILGNGSVWSTRLGRVIRVQNGLAYDTFSAVTQTRGDGYFWAQFGSNPENVDKAMALLKQEVQKIRDEGVTEEEVKDAITYKLGAFPRQTETADDKAGVLLDIGWYQLGLDYVTRRAEEYRAVTKEKVDAVAKKYLDSTDMIEVIVGTYGKK